jgi:imidazolonepropionase-like amidohydrolase
MLEVQALLSILILTAGPSLPPQETPSRVLIENVRIWDGKADAVSAQTKVLVVGELIAEVSPTATTGPGATVIDGGGRVLMPGLIDAHTHLMLNAATAAESVYEESWSYAGAKAVAAAEAMLLRGYTTVRDVGGPVGGLKRAIDEGLVSGPRIFPSGPYITQTSGHGDLETSAERPSPYFTGIPDKAALFGWAFLADGVPEVQKAAREVLRTGATQIKVMAGGGVSSYYDPLHTTQYTVEELRAIVTEAEHWGTYVVVHAYTDAAVRAAVEAGVKCIDHGPFISEEVLAMMAEKGVWLSPQAYLFGLTPEELGIMGTPSEPKMVQVNEGSANLMRWAKQHGVNIAWGTDLFGPPAKAVLQPQELLARLEYFSPVEILRQATSENARLLELSGKLHPYRAGPLGVVAPGAYADLLLVDGEPLEELELFADWEANLRLILKGGVVAKNTL